jgi:hypothetical protein
MPFQAVQVQQVQTPFVGTLPPGMAGVMAATANSQASHSLLMQLQQQQRLAGAGGLVPAGLGAMLSPATLAALQQQSLMRISVDKGRQTDLDHDFVAEDTTAKDHADEVMRRCEDVTKMLRKTLGKHTEGDR